jgi:recombination protein RecA
VNKKDKPVSVEKVVKVSKKKNIVEKVKKENNFSKNDERELEKFRNNTLDEMMSFLVKNNDDIAVYKLNDPNVPTRIKRVIPTGLPGFDIVAAKTPLGRTGFPIGRQVEVSGENASGKTSLACQIAGSAQKRLGWNVVWIEHENKFDPDRAELLGLNVDKCIFLQPTFFEETIGIIDQVMDSTPERNSLPDELKMFGTLIVVDSVAAMPTELELKGKLDAANIGVFQRRMSQAQRRITNRLSKRNITILWINQLRDKIGFGTKGGGGKNTYGGNALKFYCAQRWKIWSQMVKGVHSPKGIMMHVQNIKNQCGSIPYLECNVYLDFKKGFDYIDSWVEALASLCMVEKTGRSVKFLVGPNDGMKVSINKLKDMFEENPKLFIDYEKLMKDHMGNYTFISSKKDKKSKDEDESKDEKDSGEAEE